VTLNRKIILNHTHKSKREMQLFELHNHVRLVVDNDAGGSIFKLFGLNVPD
jgi:hypothetical protein